MITLASSSQVTAGESLDHLTLAKIMYVSPLD
jgi:hypothetical protein